MLTSKTWWGSIFLHSLEEIMDEGRLHRGRSYAKSDRLVEFEMKDGSIYAKSKGNINHYFRVYKTPYYDIDFSLKRVSTKHWVRILKKIGKNADWVTHLILGEVPPSIESAFRGANVNLLPKHGSEITSSCSCPDWANPCKHIAGAYIHLATLLDRDPLILFELRGLERTKLIEEISKSPFGAALQEFVSDEESKIGMRVSKRFEEVGSIEINDSASDLVNFWRGKPLPPDSVRSQQVPPVSALLLRREGDYPDFWNRQNSFIDAMAAIYERVAKQLP